MGLHQEFISPAEVAERHPLIDPKHYYAALWDDQDRDLDPSGATYVVAKSARVHGAQYFTHTRHCNHATRAMAVGMSPPRGVVNAEIIVNCGGLWARGLAKWVAKRASTADGTALFADRKIMRLQILALVSLRH